MKGLINLFVRRPVTVIMILTAQIIAAIFSLFTLPVNRLPDFSVPSVTAETVYPGMAANEVRSLVTIPLEDCLSPVKGLKKIQSVSRDNRSLISMDFHWGTDPMAAAVLVREAVDSAYPSLPEGVRKPLVTSAASVGGSASEPHAVIAVYSNNGNGEFARNLAEYELRARLRKIDGVGSIVLSGGEVKEERLLLDVPRLAALGLAPSEFAGLLSQETSDVPAGNAREGNMELVVVSSGRLKSTYDLKKVILPFSNGTLTVEDAGYLGSFAAKRESVFVCNGKEAVSLEIYRRLGSDPLRLSKEIRNTVDEAASLFSRDAQIEIVHDSSPSLVSGIKSLLISAALGAFAVIAVLFIFFRCIRYGMIASFSIPFSAAAGICMLAAAGKSLNGISLCGLAMGIGLVSDISVIVLDLLHRAFGKRNSIPDCEEIGEKAFSIASSSIASTLTTTLVFFPIMFLPGPLGNLFGDIAIGITASVAAGWFYAQFCLPSLYRMNFGKSINQFSVKIILKFKDFEKFQYIRNIIKKLQSVFSKIVIAINSVEKKYSRVLLFLLHNPKKLLITASFPVIIGILCILTRPVVFINPDEADEVCISLILPHGTLMEEVSAAGISISGVISALPIVKTVYGRAGAEEEDINRRADTDYIKEELILHCVLKKGTKPQKALAAINNAVFSMEKNLQSGLNYKILAYLPKDRTEMLLGLSAEKTFVISGKDRDELVERLEIVQNTLEKADVADMVTLRPGGLRPELRFFPNREASAFLSIPAAQIAETLFLLNEGIVASKLEIEGRSINVRVTGQNIHIASFENDFSLIDPVQSLEQIPIKTAQGKTVYLGSLGKIERKEAEASLARLDRGDVFYADINSAKKIPAAVKKLEARHSWFTKADESAFSQYKNSLLLYVILVLFLLYMTMGAQFESFLLPLILMISIPLSFAGSGFTLLISGLKIDSGTVLGLAALFGLVVNNSLILFEISEEKIRSGFSVAAAVYCGASERLLAILITTATTIFALFPLLISPMGNSQKSMAAAMMGGLAASALLSLFVIPFVLIQFLKWKHCRGDTK